MNTDLIVYLSFASLFVFMLSVLIFLMDDRKDMARAIVACWLNFVNFIGKTINKIFFIGRDQQYHCPRQVYFDGRTFSWQIRRLPGADYFIRSKRKDKHKKNKFKIPRN